MEKKLINIAFIVGIIYFLCLAFIGTKLINQNKSIKEHSEALKAQIARLEEENSTMKTELNNKVEELEKINEEFKDLNNKYQKEIEPVSFNPGNLSWPSNANVRKIRKGLEGTELYSLANDYIDAEKQYGVNAVF